MSRKSSPKARFDWREDLASSRDLNERQISGFGCFLGWFENWRLRARLPADREVARRFWKEMVQQKKREPWQLEQWAESMRWYLRWLELARRSGGDHRSLPERVRDAVRAVGRLTIVDW